MKNIFKKNQLMITALAIMIAIAGYLQFAGESLEGEYLAVNDENVYTLFFNQKYFDKEDNIELALSVRFK